MAYFLTADGGTESLRARIYTPEGACIASHAEPYDTIFLPGARAEQRPDDWWACLCKAVHACLSQADLHGDQITAMAYATTCCTVVALDRQGRPLRNALMWMDVRASHEADLVLQTGDERLKLNGNGHGPVSAEWMIPKALWMFRHEPDIYKQAHTICEYQDFLTLKLTGERCASLDNVGLRWHYANREGGWPETLVGALGMADLLDKWPSRVAAPGEVIGPLCQSAAEALGLTTKTLVVQGGADALIGMIGLGVSQPGQLCLITGSSHLQFGVTQTPFHASGMWGAYADIVYPDRYIIEGGQTSTGSIINWLKRFVSGEMDFDEMNRKAAALAPGSEGLIVQDHFQGNRTPYTDALSRGAITGLTLMHEPHHVFRAVMEGIAMGTRAILDAFAEGGYQGTEMIAGGGATNSDLFMQIHADVAGLPLRVPASTDGPSLGSAILAAYGAGQFASIDEGIAAMVKPGRLVAPNPAAASAYDEIYQRYLALYPALKGALEA